MITSEEILAKAVIVRAIEDCFDLKKQPKNYKESTKRVQGNKKTVDQMIKEDARNFLCAESGSWREARATWCEAAGIPQDWLLKFGKYMEARNWIPDESLKKMRKVLNY